MKKHIFEIIWLTTILVVVGQIIFFVSKKDLPEGLIVLEKSKAGDKNSVHLTHSLNNRYLSNAPSDVTTPPPTISKEQVTQIKEEKVDEDAADQLDYSFTTLPGTQFQLKLTSSGEFEQVQHQPNTSNPTQVIEDLVIEAEPLKRINPSSGLDEASESQDQPLN